MSGTGFVWQLRLVLNGGFGDTDRFGRVPSGGAIDGLSSVWLRGSVGSGLLARV